MAQQKAKYMCANVKNVNYIFVEDYIFVVKVF